MRETAFIREPSLAYFIILEQLGPFFFKVFNGHFIFHHKIGVIRKKFFCLRLECLPRRIRNNRVKATALVDDLIKLIPPVKRRKRFYVFKSQRTSLWLTFLFLVLIPSRLLEFDS